jgi:chemotaxis protein histidine kinase CheA
VATEVENALNRLRRDFKVRAEGMLDDLEQVLRATDFDDPHAVASLGRRLYGDAHSLKGSGGTAGFHFLSKVAHALEDYLSACAWQVDRNNLGDVHRFLDAMRDSLEDEHSGDNPDGQAILDSLPKGNLAGSPAYQPAQPTLRAMVVNLSKTANAIVTRALQAQGASVEVMPTASDALGAAVRSRPEVILLSGIMTELYASDFVGAIRAMGPTSHAYIGVVTSLPESHSALNRLPKDCRVFRQSGRLYADIEGFLRDVIRVQAG